MPLAKCHTRCWDSAKTRRYYPGDMDNIDPDAQVASCFEFLEPVHGPAPSPAHAPDSNAVPDPSQDRAPVAKKRKR